MANNMSFRGKLGDLRDEYRYTHLNIIDRIEKMGGDPPSQAFISRMLTSDMLPNSHLVIDLARIFDVTPDCLLLPVDLDLGKKISRVARLMMRMSPEGVDQVVACASDTLEGERETREKALSLAENLLEIIEKSGNQSAISEAKKIVYGQAATRSASSISSS